MRRLGLALTLSLGFATAAWPADDEAERTALQQTWHAVAAERDGMPAPELVGHRLTLTQDRFRITRDGRLLFGGRYATDPSTRPASIAFHQDEGPSLRGEWRGIYRVSDDRLDIVDNADDQQKSPPTQFATTPGSGYVLVRFEPARRTP
ncbi:hypothetical protein OPKNFCMD_0721 [Methylobacterium crusticola]|uniref:Lipocalin-like domain-containing protein n=1 Tax=Methylobacterium crusticola TaxID=1697972 RepID=A0ABQ4QTU0_9HYPH|nr:TIGR03067 domain-containing protein [Methylobacterium crusticola]GJD48007.1 hypothetical protein OPKNFCMD_0721 [Methylobacterium crusticola]